MNDKDNPFFNLLEIMTNQAPENKSIIHYGVVESINPLSVRVNNITLDQVDIKINSSIKIYDSTVNELNKNEYLNVNDEVVLLSEDFQDFILLCKVVQNV